MMNGIHGWLVIRCADQKVIASQNAEAWFPLASTGKLVLASVVVEAIQNGELRWESRLPDVTFDPKENSHLLYPHLQGVIPVELRDVVEVMIACHDQHCAKAIAQVLGGWDNVQERVRRLFPHTKIDQNPRDMERNCARLDDLATLLMKIVTGYRTEPSLWKPIVAGLVRQEDKVQTLPAHEVFNLTGGLPTAVIDAGILRDFSSPDQLVYVLAGKNLEDRSVSQDTDLMLAKILVTFYESNLPNTE